MPDPDLDGTTVLEQLAAVGLLDDFSDAVDADDTSRAAELMRLAGVDGPTITWVLGQMRGDEASSTR